ncbi:hypothetical protein AYI68_g152 [Smittium mucronatum]|uniref:Uncharacterized protein n=1 Tax=Smittium mucronatum TaxID=133383 RepID=A0A1R0H959_9FUNG|nr:hypothetical protein AYI68_g152 [Smittium mucronatum]
MVSGALALIGCLYYLCSIFLSTESDQCLSTNGSRPHIYRLPLLGSLAVGSWLFQRYFRALIPRGPQISILEFQ